MLINENKLRNLIRHVIKEMALSHKGIHPVGGIKNSKYDITSGETMFGVQKNRFPLNAPKKFEQRLGWILKNYPGCTIHSYMFPSNFDAAAFFKNHLYAGSDMSNLQSSRISDILTHEDEAIDRHIDITDRIDDIIYEISQELDESNPSVQKMIASLHEAQALANDDQNGVLIYFGAHTSLMGHPPTPYNMMHQVVDTTRFRNDEIYQSLYELLYQVETADGELGVSSGFFEGRAQAISSDSESVTNLIFQSAGWLNPDTCTIMNDNPKNQGLAGSSNHHDIVKRCLAPKYKNDEDVIEQMVSLGFVDLLCQLLNKFWDMFRGRVILTFSSR